MKKLNLVTSTDSLRPALQHIQVINGHVFATNCHILVKIPVHEVFGPDLIQPDEELYFSGEQWKRQNFAKAIRIIREGNTFKAFDKKGVLIGITEAMTVEIFTNNVGRFPDCERVIPTTELDNINKIGFNHKLYSDIVECFNLETPIFYMEFRGERKAIIVRNGPGHTEGFGLIMPIAID
jgi:hypothetical protein